MNCGIMQVLLSAKNSELNFWNKFEMKNQKQHKELQKIKYFFFTIDYKLSRALRNTKDCENCKYFGGLMCDHVDENNKCLGWERYKRHPIKDIKYRIKMKRLVKKMRLDPSFKHFKIKK